MTIVLALRARTPRSNTTYVFRVSKGIACRKMLFGKTLIVGGSDFWYQSQSKFSSHSFIFAIVICGWKAMLVHSSWLKIWPDKSSVRRFVVPQTCFMRVLKPIGSFHTRNIKKSLRKLICAVFKSVMDSKRICWCLSVDVRVLIFKNVLVARIIMNTSDVEQQYGTENLTTWFQTIAPACFFSRRSRLISVHHTISNCPTPSRSSSTCVRARSASLVFVIIASAFDCSSYFLWYECHVQNKNGVISKRSLEHSFSWRNVSLSNIKCENDWNSRASRSNTAYVLIETVKIVFRFNAMFFKLFYSVFVIRTVFF